MTKITKVRIQGLKRGFKVSNGKCPTKYLVELGGDKRWRRVYDRMVSPRQGKLAAKFVACVLDSEGYRDLTQDESQLISYDFHTCRVIP